MLPYFTVDLMWWVMVDASYSGNCRSRWDTCYRSRWYTCWNLAGPQRITAFKPPYFADRYIENIWMAANKAGKEHRLGRKGIVQRIQTELVRLPIVLEGSERLPVDACLSGPCLSAAAATI